MKLKWKLLSIAVVAAGASLLMSGNAHANNHQYFDGNTVLIVGQTQYVQRATVRVKAYFNNPTNNRIYLDNYHYCPTNSWDLRQSGDRFNGSAGGNRGIANGTNITRFAFTSAAGNNTTHGEMRRTTGCSGASGMYTYIVPNFTESQRDPATGRFVVTVTVTHVDRFPGHWDGIQNGFRIRTGNNNVNIVTHAAGDGHEVTLERQQKGGSNRYHNYNIRFGSSCEVTSNTTASIRFYDLDNNQADVQPQSMRVRLREADRGSTNWTWLNFTVPGGGTSNNWSPPSIQNANTTISFTARPDKRYELHMNNVYDNNTVQFGLPYDGIFYHPGCMEWDMDPDTRVFSHPSGTASGVNGSNIATRWNSYRTTAASGANRYEVERGDNVFFMHRVQNVGSGGIGSGQMFSGNIQAYVQSYYSDSYPTHAKGYTVSSAPTSWSPQGRQLTSYGYTASQTRYYHIGTHPTSTALQWWSGTPGAANRNYYCQRIAVPNKATLRTQWFFSRPACVALVDPPLDFDLTPTVGAGTRISIGQQFEVDSSVTNSGSTASDGSFGGLIRVVMPRTITASPPNARENVVSSNPSSNSSQWACNLANQLFGAGNLKDHGGSRCALVNQSDSFPAGPNGIEDLTTSQTITAGMDVEPGDRVCYFAAVSRYNQSVANTRNRLSGASCFIVAKSPTVQITGGDVVIRTDNGRIMTSSLLSDGRRYGSWIEYAALAPGAIQTYTGGVLKGGSTTATPNPKGLTFANNGVNSGTFTTVSGMGPSPELMANFTESRGWHQVNLPSTTVNSSTSLQSFRKYTRSETVTINGLNDFNNSVVIEADTIIINGDITYRSGTYSNINELPQLILKAGTIRINASVSNVDAWLLGTTVSTCNAPTTPYYNGLTLNNCNNPLTINGPIQARVLQLRRTAGADGTTAATLSQSAEHLNLRADAYMWLYAQSSRSSVSATVDHTIRTEYIRELSPRY